MRYCQEMPVLKAVTVKGRCNARAAARLDERAADGSEQRVQRVQQAHAAELLREAPPVPGRLDLCAGLPPRKRLRHVPACGAAGSGQAYRSAREPDIIAPALSCDRIHSGQPQHQPSSLMRSKTEMQASQWQ